MPRAGCLCLAVALGALAACEGPHPFVRASTPTSVDITYAGDITAAQPLAERHCAQFARVPRLAYRTTDEAQYDCVNPPPAGH